MKTNSSGAIKFTLPLTHITHMVILRGEKNPTRYIKIKSVKSTLYFSEELRLELRWRKCRNCPVPLREELCVQKQGLARDAVQWESALPRKL